MMSHCRQLFHSQASFDLREELWEVALGPTMELPISDWHRELLIRQSFGWRQKSEWDGRQSWLKNEDHFRMATMKKTSERKPSANDGMHSRVCFYFLLIDEHCKGWSMLSLCSMWPQRGNFSKQWHSLSSSHQFVLRWLVDSYCGRDWDWVVGRWVGGVTADYNDGLRWIRAVSVEEVDGTHDGRRTGSEDSSCN